jgi:hypothetical protein
MKIKHTLKNETMKLSHFNENHVSSWVCPTTRNPTVTSLKIPLAVSNEQKAMTNLFLLSLAELSS